MKSNFLEVAVSVLLIGLAVLVLNPFHFWMPDMMVLCMLGIALVIFGIFASFVLREGSVDEREDQHKALAGRNAFLTGAGVLMIGIVVQGYMHVVDPWLVIALITMILVKILSRRWSDTHL
jgi:hypothetical protein